MKNRIPKAPKPPKPPKQPRFHKKPSKKMIIIFVVIFILLGIVGGFYLYTSKTNKPFSFQTAKTLVIQTKNKIVKKDKKKDTKKQTQKKTEQKKDQKKSTVKTTKKETKAPVKKEVKKDVVIKQVDYTCYNWLGLNLRNKPDGKVIYGINKNSILNVIEELDSGWIKVKVADKEGYIATKYTKDRNGYFRDSYKTRKLTKHCKDLINKYFTNEEKKILNEYEFRYLADWIADSGAGTGYAINGITSSEPKVIYLRDSTFKTAQSHDEIILHELCHIITPDKYGYNSPFANRLKVAGYDAGLKKVKIHVSKTEQAWVSTGR